MSGINHLLKIMAQLRDKEKGCPWDVEQDFASIAPHTLEEAYEVVDAIEKKDMKGLREELGDLLLQVVFHAQMAAEEGLFTFDDVAEGICDKLTKRHPHVFGNEKILTSAEQSEAWEKHKEKEKALEEHGMDANIFRGVTLALPAMTRALKLQKRAARYGFDWPEVKYAFEKLDEEIGELHHTLKTGGAHEEKLEEIGDMLFSCVNIARKLEIDPEEAVRFSNAKFESRLKYIQAELDLQRLRMQDASLQELDELWDQAKVAEGTLEKEEK
jgi:MazG family protein